MGKIFRAMCRWLGERLAHYLSKPIWDFEPLVVGTDADWTQVVELCDVVLVEGNTRVSVAIKYLTQSRWSHACLYVGERDGRPMLVEADVSHGVVTVSVEKFRHANVRICRPHGLSPRDKQAIVDFVCAHIGDQYDLRNVIDLARYLLPTPPVPSRWRRRLLTLGSGEPTRAICSTLIAQGFQQIRYPVLPISWWSSDDPNERYVVYQARHYSLFTPNDFDLSPYFEIVKPTLTRPFDHRVLQWDPADRADVRATADPDS